ncbi:MAG TPA: NUDIX hydrolase [Acidobacteriota bacterium]|nr:NUDIX hydrolase [Acidobacteriota bacterium]
MSHEILPWRKLSTEQIADCKVFTVNRDRVCAPGEPDEKAHSFFVIHPANWVNVIPITPDGKVLLIEQFRHGIEQVALEIPGGMIDPEDPSPEAAAARELLEETGYRADEITILGKHFPNPAIQNNVCYSILARNVRQVQTPSMDGTEDIAMKLVPLEEIPELIASGAITHALVIVAFYYLELWKKGQR